jgi:cell division protein FtsI (penicillin-binding protein 3)
MAVEKSNILKKLYPIAFVMLVFAVLIVYKLVNITLIEGEKYKKDAEERIVKEFDIAANRGNIYANDGNLLATSVSKFDVRMDLVTIPAKYFNKYVKDLSVELSKMFGKKSASEYELWLRKARKHKNRYLLIAKNLTYNEYQRVKKFPLFKLGPYKGGMITEKRLVRERPIGRIAERTIGWDEKRIDASGRPYPVHVGIEGNFRKYLRGKNGRQVKQKIAKGQWKPIFDAQQIDPIDGQDIVTTIDTNIQDIAHHALLESLEKFEAEHGTVVVMETKTGEIRAISNLGRNGNGVYYEKLNYAIGESHEPGSTFKVASMVVALEDKVIDTGKIIDTKDGKLRFYNRIVRDSHHGGYGKISASRVIELSSNVGIAKIITDAYDNNPQRFIDGLKKLHLDKPLNLPIKGEGRPKLPNPKDKKHWYGTTLPWMSFGYGVQLTPMQTLTFYNALANNGKMVKPMFVKEIKEHNKTIKKFKTEVIDSKICSNKTITKITEMLKNVVKRGTAKNIYNPNYFLAGKTGTCQVNYGKGEEIQYIASFAGYFPADNPQYSCIVVIHKPNKKIGFYGNVVAAPVFQKIAQKLYTDNPKIKKIYPNNRQYAMLDKRYSEFDKKVQKNYTVVPDVKGMAGMDAISILENLGLKVQYSGMGKVKMQSIKSGKKIGKGKTIKLELI